MKSLLLSFPEFLISASDKAANNLGISRSEFIRQSVVLFFQIEPAKNSCSHCYGAMLLVNEDTCTVVVINRKL